MTTPMMLHDDREIMTVNDERAGQTVAAVGSHGVTKIECYGEPGDNALKPWFAVYQGDFLAQRFDATGMTVYYRPPHRERTTDAD